TREVELEEALRDSCKTNSELIKDLKNYRKVYSEFSKNIKQDKAQLQRDLNKTSKDKEILTKQAYQLIEEVKRLNSEINSLIYQITRKDISLNESKIKIKDLQSKIKILETKLSSTQNESKKIRSLESMVKILESKLSSAQKDVISIQNDSSKKESEIVALKSELVDLKNELVSNISELERLKSETIPKPIVGGDDEKNIIKDNDLSKYFVRRKNMDPIEKIDGNISTYTNDEITKLPKNDTKINSKVSDETSINEIGEDIIPQSQEIKNVTPYLAQPENYTPSLTEPHPQISIEGIGTIPIVASTLMSPLSAYMLLTLLIIAVMWFVVLRRTWDIGKKVMIEAVIYIDSQRAHDLDREIILQKLYYRPDGYYLTVEKMHNACKKAGYNFSLNDMRSPSGVDGGFCSGFYDKKRKWYGVKEDFRTLSNKYYFIKADNSETIEEAYKRINEESEAIAEKTNGLVDMRKSGSYTLTSLKLFRETTLAPNRRGKIDEKENAWLNLATTGALVFAEKYEGEAIQYDVNSMYIYEMLKKEASWPITTATIEGKPPKKSLQCTRYLRYNPHGIYTHFDLECAKRNGLKNVTPYLAQPENYTPSLTEPHPQISIEGIGTIPIVASTLMSPLSAYMLLTLLIIAVMWFVVLRRTWDIGKKVMIEAVIYIDSQRAHDLD
ncbi:7026_t:CDS:2, partial [Entrophospora sp. SA101]